MYILTDNNDVIICISEILEYDKAKNPKVRNKEMGDFFMAKRLVAHTYENVEIPNEKIKEAKYCYTEEKGFYKNENYKEFFSDQERITALEEVVNNLLGF